MRKQICIPSDTGYSLKVYRFASTPFNSDCELYNKLVFIRLLLGQLLTIVQNINSDGKPDLKALVESLEEIISYLIILYDDAINKFNGLCTNKTTTDSGRTSTDIETSTTALKSTHSTIEIESTTTIKGIPSTYAKQNIRNPRPGRTTSGATQGF